jgi:hypothetical protein
MQNKTPQATQESATLGRPKSPKDNLEYQRKKH